jgi:hypothetical protein
LVSAAGAALGGGQERDYREGECGHSDAGDGVFGLPAVERAKDIDGDEGGQCKEGDGDAPQGRLLTGLARGVLVGGACAQTGSASRQRPDHRVRGGLPQLLVLQFQDLHDAGELLDLEGEAVAFFA